MANKDSNFVERGDIVMGATFELNRDSRHFFLLPGMHEIQLPNRSAPPATDPSSCRKNNSSPLVADSKKITSSRQIYSLPASRRFLHRSRRCTPRRPPFVYAYPILPPSSLFHFA